MNSFNHRYYDFFFLNINWIGDGWFYGFMIFLFIFIKYRWAIIAFCSFLCISLVIQCLKRVFFAEMLRPITTFDSSTSLYLLEDIAHHSYYSFPSGHSASAFSIMILLNLFIKNKKWGIIFSLLAVFAAYARVYLSQHFFEDIYAGSALGLFLTILTYIFLNRKINEKWNEKFLFKRRT